jgi:DNA-binding IclR family transcriptional regulator
MLAQLPAGQVRALYPTRESLIRRVGPGPSTLADLDHILLVTRERGWALELGDVTTDYASVGAAALDRKGYPIAGIGVTFRSGIADAAAHALGLAVVATAGALGARALGRA